MIKFPVFLFFFGIFLFFLIVPILIFKIPYQADDWSYLNLIIRQNQPFYSLYEFKRLPLEGMTLYLSYKLNVILTKDIIVNPVLFFYFCFHFVSSLLVYKISLKFLKNNYFAIISGMLFLTQPYSLDSYANLSLVVRNLGLIFVLGHVYLKVKFLDKISFWQELIVLLLIILGINFYETYLIYIVICYLLILKTKDKKSFIKIQSTETLIIILLVVLKFIFLLNNVESRGVNFNLFLIARHFMAYAATIFFPNLHGNIIFGGIIFGLTITALLSSIFLFKGNMLRRQNIILLFFSIIFFVIILSLNTYFIPRALYGASPIISLFLGFLIMSLPTVKLRSIIILLLILSSWACLIQFFYLQNQTYLFLKSAKVNKSHIPSEINHVKLFLNSGNEKFMKKILFNF